LKRNVLRVHILAAPNGQLARLALPKGVRAPRPASAEDRQLRAVTSRMRLANWAFIGAGVSIVDL
jgi:hypothetical protein